MSDFFYKLFAPSLQLDKLANLAELYQNPEVRAALEKANSQCLHWQQLRFKSWIPEQFFASKELFWTALKLERQAGSRITPIQDASGHYFKMRTDMYSEFLHVIDKEMAGNFMGVTDFSEGDKKRFIARNTIEESIASSQLEGANTSRKVAKKMLLEGRKPRNHSERMIVNNHYAMQKIEEELHKENLSTELIYELHKMITHGTLAESAQGRLRETLDDQGNPLVIKAWDDRTITYYAPKKEFVEAQLPRLIEFANDSDNKKYGFIHPLIKAIMLHFWIGLLHPFEDGNGRLARILFYWYMLKHDYWAFAYLSLSEKIKKSPKQYAMAYVYSEQDDLDLTYFIHYNIKKLQLARADFQSYVKTTISANRLNIALGQQKYALNERQIKLLQYLNQGSERYTTLTSHQKIYSIVKATAVADLAGLVNNGFLQKNKVGRNSYYYPTEKIAELFKF